MTALTTWQTDDRCPACGAPLIEISGPSSTRVIQQCRACAWSVTWAAPPLVPAAAPSQARDEPGGDSGDRRLALDAAGWTVTGGGR